MPGTVAGTSDKVIRRATLRAVSLFRRRTKQPTTVRLAADGPQRLVVGGEHYSAVPQGIRKGDQVDVELRREPTNRHDRNAIMVWCKGRHVGYLGSDTAERYAPLLDAQGGTSTAFIAEAVCEVIGRRRELRVTLPRL